MGGVGLMDVKRIWGINISKWANPKKKKKKKREHTQCLENPTWSSLGRRRRQALLREEAGTTTLVAALPGPTQNKTRIKNISTYT
jgi:hypothetical protein